MSLTPEAVLALAPDSGSASNGRKLATPAKWQNLNTAGGLLWGECQGSGQEPYLTGVDLSDLVSKCSCPSRKFPCKHALALMLLYAGQPESFGTTDTPQSLQTWQRGREQRSEAREQKAQEAAQKQADPVAQAKRRAEREKKVSAGLSGLELFLADLVREGLGQAGTRPYTDWDTQAARLVDAQAVGAARLVRELPAWLGHPAALLTRLGRLHLLCQGWRVREALPEAERADLLSAIGFPVNQAELLAGATADRWTVLGRRVQGDETLITRRQWLGRQGAEGVEWALLLDFVPAGRTLPPGLRLGHSAELELAWVPSAWPQRALLRGEASQVAPPADLPGLSLSGMLEVHARALAANPFLERTAHLLSRVQVTPGGELIDAEGGALPLQSSDEGRLQLLAVSGGGPLSLFGEWDTLGFWPLSALGPGGWWTVPGGEA